MLTQRPNESGGMLNINQLQDTAMNVVENVCSIGCRPVELVLRIHHGTRYFPVPVIFFSTMMMVFLPVFSSVTRSVVSMIPFVHIRLPMGLFGIGSLAELYFLLSFTHSIRIYRRMIDMSRETNSEFEGPPLPFFYLLPKGRNFWFTRIVWEPVFVLIAATMLGRIFIFDAGLVLYLQFAAICLAMKNFIGWFKAWAYLRDIMDMRFAGPIIAKLSENRATEEDLATIHLASFPKNLPADLRDAAVSHIAHAFSPESDAPAKH